MVDNSFTFWSQRYPATCKLCIKARDIQLPYPVSFAPYPCQDLKMEVACFRSCCLFFIFVFFSKRYSSVCIGLEVDFFHMRVCLVYIFFSVQFLLLFVGVLFISSLRTEKYRSYLNYRGMTNRVLKNDLQVDTHLFLQKQLMTNTVGENLYV